jgi:hypothetical protein
VVSLRYRTATHLCPSGSKIISATPGMEEYRQTHLAENNPGLWPAMRGVTAQ